MKRRKQRMTTVDTLTVAYDPGVGLRSFASVMDPNRPPVASRNRRSKAAPTEATIPTRTYSPSRGCESHFPGCTGSMCDTHPTAADVAEDTDADDAMILWAFASANQFPVFKALVTRDYLPYQVADGLFSQHTHNRRSYLGTNHVVTGAVADRVALLVGSSHVDTDRLRRVLHWRDLDGVAAALLVDVLGSDAAFVLLVNHPRSAEILNAVEMFGDWDARVGVALCRGASHPASAAKLRRTVSEVAARCGRDPSIPFVISSIAQGWNGSTSELIIATKLVLSIS